MSLLEGFESKEAFLKYAEEVLFEKDGKFFIQEVLDLKKEGDTRKEVLDKEIGQKKAALKRAQDAETASKTLEGQIAAQLVEIEALKATGTPDEKLQALQKELATARQEARNHDLAAKELQKLLDATKEPLEKLVRLEIEARNARIYDSVRKDAIEAKVPREIYDSEEFRDHILARFLIDENTDEVVTQGDSAMNGRQFVAAKQKQNPLWVTDSSGTSAKPGKTQPSSDGRAERFAKAQASGNIREMIANAPLVDIN